MPVLVSNLQDKVLVDDSMVDFLNDVVKKSLQEIGVDENAELSLVFVDDVYIAELNKQYRGIDKPTDVLSFAMREGQAMPGDEDELMLGDIVISLETSVRQAQEYGHDFTREVSYLTVHGVLHLLGYDHEVETERQLMREKEEAILANCMS